MQIDHAVATRVGVAKLMATKLKITGVKNRRRRRALTALERSERHERLVGRTRRVGPAQGAIQQGLIGRFAVELPHLRIDPVGEQVWVKAWLADKSEHFAVTRINCHQRTAPLAKQFFDQLLQAKVDRQHDRRAWDRRPPRKRPHWAATGRNLDLLVPGAAVQHLFVAQFNPDLADLRRTDVLPGDFSLLEARLVGLGNAPDVPNQVRRGLAQRITAKQARPHFNARQMKAVGGQCRHLFVVQARLQWDRFGRLGVLVEPAKATPVFDCDFDQAGDLIDRLL